MWLAHFTRNEFESFSVLVPEPPVLGAKHCCLSQWAQLNLGVPFKSNVVINGPYSEDLRRDWERAGLVGSHWSYMVNDSSYAEPRNLTAILHAIPDTIVHLKQDSLARLAPRAILAL